MAHLGSAEVLTYNMSRRSQRRRATIRNDPFADLSEDSRRRWQRFHNPILPNTAQNYFLFEITKPQFCQNVERIRYNLSTI